MKPLFVACVFALFSSAAAAKDVSLVFATAAQGRDILTARDDFVERLSPFDRAARVKTDKDVSEADYLKFVAANVLDWTTADKTVLEAAIADVRPRINALGLNWPGAVYLIKTTGTEEGSAAYTRANGIVLPLDQLMKRPGASLPRLIAHELFHVLSRHNPALKTKLYGAIGFKPCGEIVHPSKLLHLRITNPDAPKNDHCVRVGIAGQDAWATPILFATVEKYDTAKGGEFFNYLKFQLLRVDGGSAAAPPSPATYNDANFQLVDVANVTGFFEQVGRNTGYIIHPEEILADNFAQMVLGTTGVKSPEVHKRIQEALKP